MLEIRDGSFYLNDEKFNIYSGAIHYFRTVPEYWEDRLTKLKLAGFNTVETYVAWNLHEPKENEFDFTGMLDIVKFIETAKKVGLYVIVRPGPYICAEWDFGGLPAWLLKDRNMRVRCNYPDYLKHVKRFYKELLSRLNPHLITNGGNIIAMQVENEYGSYGNDKEYLQYIKDLMIECGVDVLLFTADGTLNSMLSGGTLDDVYKTLNFGSGAKTAFNSLARFNEVAPKMCTEFWCGWFDHWGGKHAKRSYDSVLKEISDFIDMDANFNFYMFHGGTNFGFTAGANFDSKYRPTTTSYDYCALLNEYGDYTPAYHAVRKLLLEKQNIKPEPLPPSPALQNIGEVQLTERTSLLSNIENIGEKHLSPYPEKMEYYGQNFGMIYYKTVLKGEYGLSIASVSDVHDIAYAYVNGKKQKTFDRRKNGIIKKILGKDGIVIPAFNGECEISVLVDAMGRVNYGSELYDRKGIDGISIGNQQIMGYEVYTLPLDNLEKLDFSLEEKECPSFLKGTFKTNSKADCFVHLDGFTKGSVWINGFNLGRFWKIGPQKSLYLPGVLLKENEENEIIVLELEKYKNPTITITDKHDLG